jgi:hypothetical protein
MRNCWGIRVTPGLIDHDAQMHRHVGLLPEVFHLPDAEYSR